jgi:hypothetical protein
MHLRRSCRLHVVEVRQCCTSVWRIPTVLGEDDHLSCPCRCNWVYSSHGQNPMSRKGMWDLLYTFMHCGTTRSRIFVWSLDIFVWYPPNSQTWWSRYMSTVFDAATIDSLWRSGLTRQTWITFSYLVSSEAQVRTLMVKKILLLFWQISSFISDSSPHWNLSGVHRG